mmetsp:Transcript_30140/g.68047  ORF Transcript_30140/g.68047 Transcript_30140/m.68047 type:complete len:229 (-) Transcript_30140:1204-1890(-)
MEGHLRRAPPLRVRSHPACGRPFSSAPCASRRDLRHGRCGTTRQPRQACAPHSGMPTARSRRSCGFWSGRLAGAQRRTRACTSPIRAGVCAMSTPIASPVRHACVPRALRCGCRPKGGACSAPGSACSAVAVWYSRTLDQTIAGCCCTLVCACLMSTHLCELAGRVGTALKRGAASPLTIRSSTRCGTTAKPAGTIWSFRCCTQDCCCQAWLVGTQEVCCEHHTVMLI